jgi:hypothetical protein
MPDATIATVSACLWDLRTQCEQQLRSLTSAQRLIDDFREHPEARALLKRQLVQDMDSVLRANRIVSEAAQDCSTAVHSLPAVHERPAEHGASTA